jgi:predicted membrane metal-binding protein
VTPAVTWPLFEDCAMATVLEPKLSVEAPEGSDRSFGFVFAAVFAIVTFWPLLRGGHPRWWALAVAAVFLVTALAWPRGLHPLNRIWLAFGRLLHRIVSPVVMGAIFFAVITPVGFFMRLAGKDGLGLARRADLSSYWIARTPASPASETMKRQF